MKKILIILVILVNFTSFAQDWQTNFKKAKTIASKENKQMLMVFQGSDWCAPCMKLEQEIWSSNEFKLFAKENLILVKADFPRRRKNKLSKEQQKQNDALAEKYNNQGLFPLVLVLDKSGKVLGKTGYKKTSPKKYIAILKNYMQSNNQNSLVSTSLD